MSITLATLQTAAATPADASTTAAKDAAQHAKLVDAAQSFEGMLLEQMLKGMQPSKDGGDSDSDDSSGGGDTMRSFGTEAVARAIAKSGGVGIAKQVVAKVTMERGQHAQRSEVQTKVSQNGADGLM